MAGKALDRRAIMEATIEKIRQRMPDETIAQYKDYGGAADVECITTGSLAADFVLGGGFARGRVIDLVGHTSSGKTTLALTAIAELQKAKKAVGEQANVLYVDAECAIDPRYAKMLGVDMDEVYLIQPDNGEDGYLAAEMFIASGVADLVVIDSIAAMIPKAMLEVELGDQPQIAMGARLDSQGIARLFNIAHKTKCTVILINQWKTAVRPNQMSRTDGVSGNQYQPGGETFKFYLTQMVELQRVGKIYEGDTLISNQVRVRVLKNKIAPPGRECDIFITFGVGLDVIQEAIELGLQTESVIRSGRSMYSVAPEIMPDLPPDEEPPRFNGRPKFVEWLKENPEIVQRIRKSISEKLLQGNSGEERIGLADGTETQDVAPITD